MIDSINPTTQGIQQLIKNQKILHRFYIDNCARPLLHWFLELSKALLIGPSIYLKDFLIRPLVPRVLSFNSLSTGNFKNPSAISALEIGTVDHFSTCRTSFARYYEIDPDDQEDTRKEK